MRRYSSAKTGHAAFKAWCETSKDGQRFCLRDDALSQGAKTFETSRLQTVVMSMAPYSVFQFYLGMDLVLNALARTEDIYVDQAVWYDEKMRSMLGCNCGYHSGRPLIDFPLIGMGLYYVASFFIVVPALMTLGLHPLAAKRKESDPIIYAGGGAMTSNPEPVADFFDFIVIGDAEIVLPEILRRRRKGQTKREYLEEIYADFDCVYVPSLPGRTVVKRSEPQIVPLDASCFTSKPVNKTVEIMRGCAYKCNFCNLGWTRDKPAMAKPEDVIRAIRSYPNGTSIYPFAPDESSYPYYDKIKAELGDRKLYRYNQRVNTFAGMLRKGERMDADEYSRIVHGIDGISGRCRRWVNKRISDADIRYVLEYDLAHYMTVKLNVIYALPIENAEDWREWRAFLNEVMNMRTRCGNPAWWMTEEELQCRTHGERWAEVRKRKPKIQMIDIGPTMFQPEPHTPMQWFPSCASQAAINNMYSAIKEMTTKYGGIKLEGQEGVTTSHAVVALKRGDRSFSRHLLKMAVAGVYQWPTASKKLLGMLAAKGDLRNRIGGIEPDAELPWDFIDVGIPKSKLKTIYLEMTK